MTQTEMIRKDIANKLEGFLNENLTILFYVTQHDNEIEIIGEPDTKNEFVMFYLSIQDNLIDVTRIFLPPPSKGKRIGITLIKTAYSEAQFYNYETVISQMTDSFFRYMINKGAKQVNVQGDAVQILPATNL